MLLYWLMSHHSQCGSEHGTGALLTHQTQMLQSLWGSVHKRRGERRIVPTDHRVSWNAGRWTSIGQLSEVRDHVWDAQRRVRVQRYGRDLKLLITQIGGVKRLRRHRHAVIKTFHSNHTQCVCVCVCYLCWWEKVMSLSTDGQIVITASRELINTNTQLHELLLLKLPNEWTCKKIHITYIIIWYCHCVQVWHFSHVFIFENKD